MNFKALKYTMIWTGLACGAISLYADNWLAYSMPIYAFAIIPLIELFLRPNEVNMNKAELEIAKHDPIYDYMLYFLVLAQYTLTVWFLFAISEPGQPVYVMIGKIWAFGIGCAVLGINVGHELGHRHTRHEQFMSKALLLTSLYMHFFIEHNRGHHKNVSTPEDPATSRLGETIYAFWFRSVTGGYFSAWRIENTRLRRKGLPVLSIHNEMVQYQLIQGAAVAGVGLLFGWQTMLFFVLGAVMGFLMLETVNYIEHYGLQRKRLPNGTYEAIQPHHSWNSDHPLGRLLLFELSRHSDHHYRAGRKYQTLRHFDKVPQMPTGYPGMMVLSMFPPAWFYVMRRELAAFEETVPEAMAVA